VKLLLDTHVFLWWRANDRRLKRVARDAIADADVVFVSAVTAWEAAIKAALGRLRYPDTIDSVVEDSGFEKLSITLAHAERAARLPRHHADPFDRMLVAQSEMEDLTLVTSDRALGAYARPIVWT
jgi:PIN domain nuclease of toxin-antitoxin system